MDETSKIVLTALWAIVIYVVGKLLERIIVDPIVELRKAVGEVDFALVYYANMWGNPLSFPEREQEPPPQGVV